MTRKDYIAIAKVINGAKLAAQANDLPIASVVQIAVDLAEVCKANPRFDRDRFLRACGIAH